MRIYPYWSVGMSYHLALIRLKTNGRVVCICCLQLSPAECEIISAGRLQGQPGIVLWNYAEAEELVGEQ